MLIGFSTGALSRGDFAAALAMLEGKGTNAIELSALRISELDPLLRAIDSLRLDAFQHVAFHAPSRLDGRSERELATLIAEAIPHHWLVIVHPDIICDCSAWEPIGSRLCIENMDKSKPTGRTAAELMPLFECLPDAALCLDLAHARQIDPTMSQAAELIATLGDRIAQIHLSDINASGRHLPLTSAAIYACQKVVPLLRRQVPVIIESIVPETGIEHELAMTREAMTVGATVGDV